MLNVTTCMGNCCYLAVAGDVYDGVFLCCPVLDEIWDLIESVFEGFLTYSSNPIYVHKIGQNF